MRTAYIGASAVGAAILTMIGMSGAAGQQGPSANPQSQGSENGMAQQHPYVGMWVTRDGHIRQELLPNGRYDEARGTRKSAYQGRYEVRNNQILYWDDTGFTADGEFVDANTLHHGGMIFYRE